MAYHTAQFTFINIIMAQQFWLPFMWKTDVKS